MTNDTEGFYAKRFDVTVGDFVLTNQTGTRAAIHRDGLVIDPKSQAFCPHEWINDRGYISLELSQKHPYRREA